ncbi:hypothetical protein BJ741DRAFT_623473 [Chytriomyces cf. hyalinus JEL632]|nr:hypothetical protein BJ741DRAFT_623473 [Chytriomyces cf. hyalinus JEL632]
MGKTGKQHKKLKQLHAMTTSDILESDTRTPGLKRSSPDADTEAEIEADEQQPGMECHIIGGTRVSFAEISATMKGNTFKPLRAMLHSLRAEAKVHAGIGAGASLSGRVGDAVSDQRWQDAMDALSEMRAQRQYPRLGALQRWVRDCDAAASTTTLKRDTQVMRVLDAILRTADPKTNGALAAWTSDFKSFKVVDGIRMLGIWDPYPDRLEKDAVVQSGTQVAPSPAQESQYNPLLKTICQEKGHEHPSIIRYSLNVQPKKIQAPILQDTILIQNLLTLDECRQILLAGESVGFTPDEPVVDTANSRSTLAHNVIWLTDSKLAQTIHERSTPHLPATMPEDGDVYNNESTSHRVLDGINPRWRVYRYVPGAIYRPHIDGGWPKSEYNVDTDTYTFDASQGSTWSRRTFLIYLNEGFEGGETTYFVPSKDSVGVLDGKSVVPRAGCAMVFPHGSVKGNLLHEGSGVTKGVKYIARTDVLYRKVE